ncbi:MAG: peptidase M48 [Anaeromyxobacter sp. RBG_16_69_14]|nr:MAG: peptidase M48 [Anaeromyxobacter sp. RBG_16_69_14]
MPVPAAPGRATLDFFTAQANARRRTVILVVSFALAIAVVVAMVYAALVVAAGAAGATTPSFQVDGATGAPPLQFVQPGLLLAAAAGVAAVTGLGGAYHAVRLSSGGGTAVAEMLGGAAVERGSRDPALRRLVNVVEEMAIAAGLPVPQLYVLEREGSINAFAAGYTPGHSVVAVTRGALDRLTRDELQGVVAHELSHVLNADTRIDLQLMAAVGGLTALSLVGRVILRATPSSSRSRGDDKGRGALVMVGLGLMAAGAFGALCGKLVRYAVARQREWLADSSAVQFTRNPDGLAGALRKIAHEGSTIMSPHAPEAAHLFFASGATGFFSDLFSTHPSIEERIRRIAPHAAVSVGASTRAQRRPSPASPAPASPAVPVPRGLAPTTTASDRAGIPPPLASRPAPEHILRATDLLERMPSLLVATAREPFGARAIACALLVGGAPDVRARQLAYLGGRDAALRAEVERLAPAIDTVARKDRLSLIGLALPGLDALSPGQAEALGTDLRALADADGSVTLFEWAVRRVVLRRLARDRGAPPRVRLRTLDEAQPECLDLLSTLAWMGGRHQAAAQSALDAGVRALGFRAHLRLLPYDRIGSVRLDATLSRLDEAAPAVKAHVLDACVATVLADDQVTIEEAELVRGVSASLGLAMPPIVPSVAAPVSP